MSGRRYTISLSPAGVVTSVIIGIIAIGWIFAFGVIVGRGYNPETQISELTNLLPPPQEEEKTEPILKPEELKFMSELKDKEARTIRLPQSSAQNASVQLTDIESRTAASASTHVEKNAAADKKTAADKSVPSLEKKGSERFDFVFQAVAYKKREQADSLREKLEGEGLRTRLNIDKDKDGKPRWYRVQVLYRGTESDLDHVRAIMDDMNIREPKLISKQPVKR